MAEANASAARGGGRKRRKPRSLLLLLKSLVGLRVRVDLKNDVVLEGVVQEVVRDMECVAWIKLYVSSCDDGGDKRSR